MPDRDAVAARAGRIKPAGDRHHNSCKACSTGHFRRPSRGATHMSAMSNGVFSMTDAGAAPYRITRISDAQGVRPELTKNLRRSIAEASKRMFDWQRVAKDNPCERCWSIARMPDWQILLRSPAQQSANTFGLIATRHKPSDQDIAEPPRTFGSPHLWSPRQAKTGAAITLL